MLASPGHIAYLSRAWKGLQIILLIKRRSSRRTGFNRQPEGANGTSPQRANGSPNPSPTAFSPTMAPPTQPTTFSAPTGSNSENSAHNIDTSMTPEQPKYFFQEKYAKLGVKGNFMPLAAQPTNIELADWLAHQSKVQ